MSEKMAFLLFGDQSLDTHIFLNDFCRRGNPSVLAHSFLEKVGIALKHEIKKFSSLDRQRLPLFSSIQQLNEEYNKLPLKHCGVDSALLCITQLANYIE